MTRNRASQRPPTSVGGQLRLLLAALLCSIAVFAASASAEDKEVCLSCHADQDLRGPAGQSLFIDGDRFGLSVHCLFDCMDCHSDAAEIPHPDKLSPVTLEVCTTCHQDAVDEYRSGTHSAARDEGVTEAAACADCHGDTHSTLSYRDPDSKAHWSNLVHTCAQCHAKQELAEKLKLPVVRSVETYLQSGHARIVAEGGGRAAVCSDCHGVHDVRPSHDPLSTVARANISTTCGSCHEEIEQQYAVSVHGVGLARGIREVPVCTDCHGEHRILGASEGTSLVAAANISTQTCGRCHEDHEGHEEEHC